MLLVAVFVLTNTVSADGSIGGVYSASLRLAEQSYAAGSKSSIKDITNSLKELVGGQGAQPATQQNPGSGQQKPAPKQDGAASKNGQNK